MEGFLAVTILHAQVFNLRREVVKAFRAQKITVGRMADAAFQPQKVPQMGVSGKRGEVKVFSSSLSIVTQIQRDGFEQRRLAGAVFTNEKRDRRMKFQPVQVKDGRNAKWIFTKVRDAIAFEPHRV